MTNEEYLDGPALAERFYGYRRRPYVYFKSRLRVYREQGYQIRTRPDPHNGNSVHYNLDDIRKMALTDRRKITY